MTRPPAPLSWRISPTTQAAALFVVASITAAVLTRRGELLAVALPLLLWLVVALRQPRPATTVLAATPTPARCREQDEIELRLDAPDDGLVYRGELLSTGDQAQVAHFGPTSWRLRLIGWGVRTVRVGVDVSTPGGAWQAQLYVAVRVVVAPRGVPGTAAVRGSVRRPGYGERVARVAGAGTEFLDVAEWHPGQPLRRVHWAATLRTGEIHVARMAADRNQDVALVVDARTEAGPLTQTTVDRAVRAAVALAEAHLRAGDRVALAMAGPRLSWVGPGTGRRHLVRIVDCLLEYRTRTSGWVDTLHIPRRLLVPGALTICLTALLNDDSLQLIGDVRRRGHPTVVVDVLDREPPIDRKREDAQALRAWRLDRIAIRQHLARRGIVTVSWPADVSLPAALRPLAARPLAAQR